jgi:hypothetical protein
MNGSWSCGGENQLSSMKGLQMKQSEKDEIKGKIENLYPRERLDIIGDFCSMCGYKKDRGFTYCVSCYNEEKDGEG